MGNVLEKPLADKTTVAGSTRDGGDDAADHPSSLALRFAVSTMQGRRKTQEDAHVYEICLRAQLSHSEWGDPLPDHSLFAVFDGHGTPFASKYCAEHFVGTLCKQKSFVEYSQKCKINPQRNGKRGRKNKGRAKSSSARECPTTNSTVIVSKDVDGSMKNLLEKALNDALIDLDAELLREMVRRKENRDAVGAAFCPGPADVENLFDEFDSGTTAVIVLTTPQYIVCSNLGDSRAILRRGEQERDHEQRDAATRSVIRLSIDHKPDNESEEIRIRDAGGVICGGKIGGRLAVSRALGDYSFKDMESILSMSNETRSNSEGIIRPEDQMVTSVPETVFIDRDTSKDRFVILGCDGIWDVVSNEECVDMVESIFSEGEGNIGLVCEEILDQCCAKGSLDNMTVIVVKFPPQQVGVGGGVMKRRKQRAAVNILEGQNLKYQRKSRG